MLTRVERAVAHLARRGLGFAGSGARAGCRRAAGGAGDLYPATGQGLGTGCGAGGPAGRAGVGRGRVRRGSSRGSRHRRLAGAARDAEAGHLMQVTDEVSRQLAELQLTLGEGPLLDTSASNGPVLASDLADAEPGTRWPAFTSAARRAGAAAVFAFPLVIGAIRAGVLGLYRDRPGPARPAE